jgi:predicted RNA-binding protein with PUA-like domain
MNYWLLKSDSDTYHWQTFLAEGKTAWTGVRNFQARNNLRKMKKGDVAFFYHSGEERQIVGVAEIMSTAYPDPTESTWDTVDVKPVKPVGRPVSIEEIRSRPALYLMPLLKQSRLSVQPMTEAEFKELLKISKTEL